MQITRNSLVTKNGAYNEHGNLIVGTQRIALNHPSSYWSQANSEISFNINLDEIKVIKEIDAAMYVGRIPMHLGHFLMEGLPRFCDVLDLNIDVVGGLTKGVLPDGIKTMREEDVEWFINTMLQNKIFHKIDNPKTEGILVKNLYIPELPYHLSHHCAEPDRMSKLIQHIVYKAREDNPDIVPYIENLHLSRYEDKKRKKGFVYSDPNEPISRQIAKISNTISLYGTVGSNTHLSLFAQYWTNTRWTPRGAYRESDRNQLICDLVKTFNTFGD